MSGYIQRAMELYTEALKLALMPNYLSASVKSRQIWFWWNAFEKMRLTLLDT
jgi:hypothetical protein